LGPTLFLVFINDLPDELFSRVGIFADDTTIYSCLGKSHTVFDKVELAADLESDLRTVTEWGDKWLVTFNSSKTKLLSINRHRTQNLPEINMNKEPLPESDFFRLLGLPFTNNLSWNKYIDQIAKAASKKVGSLYRARQFLTEEIIMYLYKSTIRACMEYCCHIWCGASATSLDTLDRIQRRIRYLVGDELFSKLQPLSHRRNVASLALFYRYFNGHCSDELASLIPDRYPVSYYNRKYRSDFNTNAVYLPRRNTSTYSESFIPRTASIWNSLPDDCFPETYNLDLFKRNANSYLSSLL